MTTLPIVSMEDRFKEGELYLFIALQGCNIQCKHCFVYDQIEGPAKDKSIDSVERLTDMYDGIIISGGEPLLHSKAIRRLLRQIDCRTILYTNGLLLNRLKWLSNYLDKIVISLKHPNDIKDLRFSYTEFLKQLSAYKKVMISNGAEIEFVIINTENVMPSYIELLGNLLSADIIVREEEFKGSNRKE